MPRDGFWYFLWSIVKSKRLAAAMIFILAAVAAAGMAFPQMNRVFQTRWFVAIGLIFLINLTACTVQQVINSCRLWRKRNSLIINIEKNVETSTFSDKYIPENVKKEIAKRRYKPVLSSAGYSLWVKGGVGIWGSVIFHAALILITLGAIASWTMKMEGHLKIAEGEVRYELHGYYDGIIEGPYFRENYHKGFGLTLQKQNIIVDRYGNVDDIISDIAVIENGRIVEQVSLGEKEPFVYRGLRIFQREAGFAPYFEIYGPEKKTLAGTYVLLETHNHANKAEFYLNGFPVPDSPYSLNIKFYPDMVRRGKEITTDKYTLTNPAAHVYVMKDRQLVAEEVIKPGESLEFDGYTVTMGDIRHWNGFDIVNDRGADIVFAGSWAALLGLGIMYLRPYKKVQVYFDKENNRTEVLGVTNRNRKFFMEELDEIRQKLAGEGESDGTY